MNLDAMISDAVQAWLIHIHTPQSKALAQHLNIIASRAQRKGRMSHRDIIANAIKGGAGAEAMLLTYSIQTLTNDVTVALNEMAGPSATP